MARLTRARDALSERVIEALAAEAESGYDLSGARRQKVGRPSLESGVSPRVSFRTSRTLYVAARKQAADEGRSIGELAREALENAVRGAR